MSAIKMDELLVSWLGNDTVYESVMELIENYQRQANMSAEKVDEKKEITELESSSVSTVSTPLKGNNSIEGMNPTSRAGVIPPFYPIKVAGRVRRRRHVKVSQKDTWDPLPEGTPVSPSNKPAPPPPAVPASVPLVKGAATQKNFKPNEPKNAKNATNDKALTAVPPPPSAQQEPLQEPCVCVRDQTLAIFTELGQGPSGAQRFLVAESFVRITKDVCGFPSFFNIPLFARVLLLWRNNHNGRSHHHRPLLHPPLAATATGNVADVITFEMFEWFWKTEMEPFDPCDRFFRLVKQVDSDSIVRDDFLPFIKALLQDHPGLEFLSSHAEFQEKYAVTVITRIFYCVNKCHSGRITARQVRRSDLLQAFAQVDEEEDINKVTRYFSYEHFYVLYCRFWELDQDRDYRITREDLLKYGDQSLSHMIVDRIFDAAPRPFEQQIQLQQQGHDVIQRHNHNDYLSYEDFIYFMLSEEDKCNEVSVNYWFTCVDVDGDGKLNNMEMRSFYAVQLHRMQFMGHEIVPFEDMLCQMMDMIKPSHQDYLVEADFLQPTCRQVSGALFDALFNLNKYLLFEQRDPFVERQKREDEFDCDWDRFANLDYSRLAMEEEAREEEAMEIDWVSVDDEEEGAGGGTSGDDDDDEDDEGITSAHSDDDSESDLQGTLLSGGTSANEAPF